MNLIKKFLLNLLLIITPSCILRAKILSLFGASIGSSCKVEQFILLNYDGTNLSNLSLGDRVYIGAGCILDLKEKLEIGNSTKIAAGCNFSTHVDSGAENYISTLYPKKEEPISIGEHCWIGLGVTVLCGVKIGSEVIIGACSLVNRDIPDAVIAMGIPATVVKSIKEIKSEG